MFPGGISIGFADLVQQFAHSHAGGPYLADCGYEQGKERIPSTHLMVELGQDLPLPLSLVVLRPLDLDWSQAVPGLHPAVRHAR